MPTIQGNSALEKAEATLLLALLLALALALLLALALAALALALALALAALAVALAVALTVAGTVGHLYSMRRLFLRAGAKKLMNAAAGPGVVR